MQTALTWLFDHTVGWLIDHTAGAIVRRAQRPDRQRGDLDALADALHRAVSACDNTRRGYSTDKAETETARRAAFEAMAIAARVPDDELIRLTKAASHLMRDFVDAKGGTRDEYTSAYETALAQLHQVRKRLT